MSDPPPRKVGSLRDRIAAFENKGASAPAPAPPPPRPKPAHVTWQPKPASPTSPKSPSSSSTHANAGDDAGGNGNRHAGMSAADAKESIGKLSLKERMAALQGSTAFGGAPPPPRPSGEKPKWKPPPVVQRVEPIGGDEAEERPAAAATSPPATAGEDEGVERVRSPPTEGEKVEEGGDGEGREEGEPDPEEEERQRRAALAARMARLGGARVGMGPPIFAKKPDIPPKKLSKSEEKPKEEEKPAEEVPKEEKLAVVSPSAEDVPEGPSVEQAAAIELPPSVAESKAESSGEYFPVRKDSGASSLLSPDSSAAPTPVRSPHMPVPQAPKRAAPPRKRPPKSPSPAPPVLDQEIQESPATSIHKHEAPSDEKDEAVALPEERGDRQPEVTEGQIGDLVKTVVPEVAEPAKEEIAEEPVAPQEPAVESHPEEHSTETSAPVIEEEEPSVRDHAHEPVTEEPQYEVPVTDEPEPEEAEAHEAEAEAEPQHEHEDDRELEQAPAPELEAPAGEPEEEEEEEEEAARRKRIAERIAKSGGFNPFAGGMPPPPSVRRESIDSVRSPVSPPPPVRRDSQQEATSPKPSLPERKASIGSVESGGARKSSLDVGEESEPSALAPASAHELHEEPIEEAYEEEEAAPRGDEHETYTEELHDENGHDEEAAVAHEGTEELENVADEPEEPVAPPPPPRATRPPPTIPQSEPEEAEEEVTPPPPPRRDFVPPPPRRVSVPPPPPPPAVDEEVEEEQESRYVDEDEAYAAHAREVGGEHEEEPVYEHDEREEEYEQFVENEPAPPPPPRPIAVPPPPPSAPSENYEEEEEEEPVPPPPPGFPSRGNSVNVPPPPPPHRVPPAVEADEEEGKPGEAEEDAVPAPPPPPPRSARPVSHIVTSLPASTRSVPAPPPLRHDLPAEREVLDEADGDPIDPGFYSPQRSAGSSLPATSPQATSLPLASLPPPPARVVSPPPVSSVPPPPQRVVSPPPPPLQRVVSPPPAPERAASPPAPERAASPPAPPITSPRAAVASPPAEPQEGKTVDDEEDDEQARRRTIAERMAKLGGLRFGAPPPMPSVRRPSEPEDERAEAEEKAEESEEVPQEEEEDEFARKQRIAARIAMQGGMRFGMLPGAAPPKPPPRVQRDEEDEESVKSPPPKRSAPVPPPPPPPLAEEDHGSESDYQHVSDSDHIEHEEIELEEVTHEDAEEEAPPPVPNRTARRVSSGPPPVPQSRPLPTPSFASAPPVPRTRPPAPSAFTYPPPPHVPQAPPTTETQGDFVVVDQPQSDEAPPPPPPRAGRAPGRAPPHAPSAAPEQADPQWEAPSMPNIDFGGETDLSLSGQWSEDSTTYPPAPAPAASAQIERPQPAAPSRPPPPEQHLTPEELQAQWGRVGVQVHEIAAAFFEKSKKTVIGDGSYLGFVNAVIGQVPNAVQPTGALDSFGYLVYSQSAAAVQRRVSDIMPGDIIVVTDAKFKGHKGLQSYHQSVGIDQPLVGVIGDFEPKKSKVKVYQANQHVGQQSVESVSYRLEDLKSGAVKIYRVLEA